MKSKANERYFSLDGKVYRDGEIPILHVTNCHETAITFDDNFFPPSNQNYVARIWVTSSDLNDRNYTAVIRAKDQLSMLDILDRNLEKAGFRLIFDAKLLYRQKRPYEAIEV